MNELSFKINEKEDLVEGNVIVGLGFISKVNKEEVQIRGKSNTYQFKLDNNEFIYNGVIN